MIPKKEAVDSAVDWTKLQNRNGVTYLPNANKPFTGYAKQSYDNDQVEVLARFADGYVVRLKQWQENGIPKWEVGYMAGKVGVDQIADGGLEELLFLHNEGSATVWYENGQKNWESYWKEGVKSGLWSGWYENGIKERESYWKDGVKVGLWNGWYKNGRKARETYWKNGKFISSVGWKPNGEKCPITNVKDGNGEVVRYCEEGNELSRLTYKDGEPLED